MVGQSSFFKLSIPSHNLRLGLEKSIILILSRDSTLALFRLLGRRVHYFKGFLATTAPGVGTAVLYDAELSFDVVVFVTIARKILQCRRR